MRFFLKKPPVKPVMKMITPGRRAYGEAWREITVAVDDDRIQIIENKAAAAPPDGKPIYVPAMGNLEVGMVDFLLEGARKTQEYGGRNPKDMSLQEFGSWMQARWLEWCEQKLRHFKGQTTVGPGGFFQRERPGRVNWTGVKPK